MCMAASRGDIASVVFPLLLTAAGFLLLTRSGRTLPRFPSTDLEHGLDRLFALLLPARKATTATVRAVVAQQTRLARLRHGARRWAKELQLISTEGYESASRISALSVPAGGQDDRALAAEAVRVLRAERASAGADLTLPDDPVSILAYGLGARPAEADLTSLEDLLSDLGLSGDRDELRTHFDDVLSAQSTAPTRSSKTRRSEACSAISQAPRSSSAPRHASSNSQRQAPQQQPARHEATTSTFAAPERGWPARGRASSPYGRMFTARAATSRTVIAESIDSAAISALAGRVSGIVSVGLNAIEFVSDM